jgi:hypothetical protein
MEKALSVERSGDLLTRLNRVRVINHKTGMESETTSSPSVEVHAEAPRQSSGVCGNEKSSAL